MTFPAFQYRLRQLFKRAKFDGGVVSQSTPVVEVVQTWNNPNETFVGKTTNITNTQSAAGSLLERWQLNGADLVSIRKDGRITVGTYGVASGGFYSANNSFDIGNSDGVFLSLGTQSANTASFQKNLMSGKANFVIAGNSTYASVAGWAPLKVQGADCNSGQDGASGLTLHGGNASPNATVNIVGGHVTVTGGNGASSSSGAASGGNITLTGGTPYGAGTKGIVTASRLRADGFATATAAKTADYTATLDDGTIEVDASGAARTITLFATSGNAGKIIVVKKIDSSANAVTIDGNASETIDGATTISLASQYSTAILQVNAGGTGWNKLAGV